MTTLDRRNALKLLASLGVAGVVAPALAGCSSSASSAGSDRTGGPIQVGLIVPQSGPLQRVGDDMSTGFNLYMTQTNQTLGGLPAVVTTIDEGATGDVGLRAVQALLATHHLHALVGVGASAVMSAIRDTVEAARIPLIGSNGSPADLRSPEYIWRTSYVNGEASTALGAYFAALPTASRPKRIVVLDDGSVDGQAEANALIAALDGTGIATTIVHTTGTATTTQLATITTSGADAVFAACSGAAAVRFIKVYRAQGITIPLYGPGQLTEGWVLGGEGTQARDVFTSMYYAPGLDNDANRRFSSAYFADSNGSATEAIPSAYAMASFDAAAVLDTAIGLISGEVTAQRINAALGRSGQFDSPRGLWQFNQSRTPQQKWYLRQVRPDGRVLINTVLQDLELLS